jgi:hypothetical protein
MNWMWHNLRNCRGFLAGLVLFLIASPSVMGSVIYENAAHPLMSTNNGPQLAHFYSREFGDEINFAGADRIITDFQFEYYGDFASAFGRTGRIRFYRNDGPGTYATPHTLLYDSGTFFINSGYNTKWITGLAVEVPNTITWSVEFSGVSDAAGDRAGLLFYHPPTTGTSARDFWAVFNGEWRLYHFGGTTFKPEANFGARIIAVPEPSTFVLLTLGGLGLLAAGRRR